MASTTHISRLHTQLQRDPQPTPWNVYLLHFPDGTHYIGSTRLGSAVRYARHLSGRGSAYVKRKMLQVGRPVLALTIHLDSEDQARLFERRFKANRQPLYNRCPLCKKEKKLWSECSDQNIPTR